MNGNDRSLIEFQFTSIDNGIVTTMFDYLIFLVFNVWQIFIANFAKRVQRKLNFLSTNLDIFCLYNQ